jgi:hypothetical protein
MDQTRSTGDIDKQLMKGNKELEFIIKKIGLFAVWCGWAGRVEVAGG